MNLYVHLKPREFGLKTEQLLNSPLFETMSLETHGKKAPNLPDTTRQVPKPECVTSTQHLPWKLISCKTSTKLLQDFQEKLREKEGASVLTLDLGISVCGEAKARGRDRASDKPWDGRS